mmetsp:Transcript_456/g.1057  ORF Transcript_456/g.1057 Transcript_456/m.1057 type:complete len:405 (+) Transcript_456:121-1335(+)
MLWRAAGAPSALRSPLSTSTLPRRTLQHVPTAATTLSNLAARSSARRAASASALSAVISTTVTTTAISEASAASTRLLGCSTARRSFVTLSLRSGGGTAASISGSIGILAARLGGAGGVASGGHGHLDTSTFLELQQTTAGPWAPLQARWAKKSKRKRRPKMGDRTEELKKNGHGQKERIFDRYLLAGETSFEVSRQIRKYLRTMTVDGRRMMRRKKDISRYTNYRVLRAAGLTHDNPQEEVDRRGFVTPMTEMQDSATLPRSALHRRFRFPHTLHYKAYWGPPSVEDEPNKYEGSMVGVVVAARLDDLPLTQQQKERLVDIVGPNCIDEETGVICLEADVFPDRNHNAAILGDMFEKLLREATTSVEERSLEELIDLTGNQPNATAAAATAIGGGRRSAAARA